MRHRFLARSVFVPSRLLRHRFNDDVTAFLQPKQQTEKHSTVYHSSEKNGLPCVESADHALDRPIKADGERASPRKNKHCPKHHTGVSHADSASEVNDVTMRNRFRAPRG